MNNECLLQWNQLKRETASTGDFPLEKLEDEINLYLRGNPETGEETVRAALRSIREALKCREHEDVIVKHKARKLLSSCRHSFDKTSRNAAHFSKALAEARERCAELQGSPKVIPLGSGFQLEEVLSIKRLMAIGKALEICVAKRETAQEYMNVVEAGKSKLWLLLKEEEPYALLGIKVDENEVEEFSARNNDDPEITYELGMELLDKLGVSADYMASFIRVGAFEKFKNGRPEVDPVCVDNREMWIWLYEDELIVGMEDHPDGKLYWSHYELSRADDKPWYDGSMNRLEWDEHCSNHLSLGMFLEIIRRNPQVLEKLNSPIVSQSSHFQIAA